MVLFAFGCYPFYNVLYMSKTAQLCIYAVGGVLAAYFIAIGITKAVTFIAEHMWILWLAISLIVAIPIIYFTRGYIVRLFKRLLLKFNDKAAQKKTPTTNNDDPQTDKK